MCKIHEKQKFSRFIARIINEKFSIFFSRSQETRRYLGLIGYRSIEILSNFNHCAEIQYCTLELFLSYVWFMYYRCHPVLEWAFERIFAVSLTLVLCSYRTQEPSLITWTCKYWNLLVKGQDVLHTHNVNCTSWVKVIPFLTPNYKNSATCKGKKYYHMPPPNSQAFYWIWDKMQAL